MDINPQYTLDKSGNPVGVFISIEEWQQISQKLHLELPQWQKDALDAELDAIETTPNYLHKWEDVKKQLLA
jgi:hypothetical protein